MKKNILWLIALIYVISGCQQSSKESDIQKKEITSENNYQHLTGAVNWYERSAEMKACYYQAYNFARMLLDKNIVRTVNRGKKNAVVVDIDETLLNNTPFEIKCMETGKGYSSDTWTEWTKLARAAALPGALEFLNYAKSKNVETFYISNRRENEMDATIKNLDSLGFPYVDKDHMLFRTEESSKKNRRAKVTETHEIILLIGDNLADLSEIFEDRSVNFGKDIVDQNKNNFGEKYIILPNPMYGDWEMALPGMNKKISDEEKGKILRQGLNSGY